MRTPRALAATVAACHLPARSVGRDGETETQRDHVGKHGIVVAVAEGNCVRGNPSEVKSIVYGWQSGSACNRDCRMPICRNKVLQRGYAWSGVSTVTAKREWPDWTPTPGELQRFPNLPRHMAGGPDNPLGARALYLGDTQYRIHGTNEPWKLGGGVSSGCIHHEGRPRGLTDEPRCRRPPRMSACGTKRTLKANLTIQPASTERR
jgi:hypothetical protein